VRQAEEVANDRGDGRPASPAGKEVAHGPPRPAPDVGRDFTGEIEEVVINEEEATELMVLDELQLVFETTHRLRVVEGARRVALPHSGLAQLGQRLGRGRATRAAEVREGVAQVARDVEGLTALGEGQRSSDSIRTVTEQRHVFVQWPQVKFAVR